MCKLAPTKQRINKKRIFGFDIETANNNKDFVLASIIGDDYQKVFYSKEDLHKEIKTNKIFRGSLIFATNLSFDFFGTFFNSDEQKNFFTLFRGSGLLLAKTYFYKNEFYPLSKPPTKSKKQLKSITFLDSMNYATLSVKKMGNIIGKSKLEHPDWLGEHPKNQKQWRQLEEYNIRDSEITFEFMKFLIDGIESLGGTFKNTIASTAIATFKNKYLEDTYYQPAKHILLEQFKSYYGGRTEAFKRGYIKDYNYYDFNSLYPSVMEEMEFPDPNTIRITKTNTKDYIMNYEGISKIKIYVPNSLKYPVLPVRLETGKVIFPTGNIEGWYTHVEIREAMKNGAVLMEVHKTQYFLKTCRPFKRFVNDMYKLRKQYKLDNSSMELVVKLIMNSLYGKFGQKFNDKDNWMHESTVTLKQIENSKEIERKGEFIRLTKDMKPASFCIPIWASYVTAYGRIKLHRAIKECEPVYVDTDSLVTKKELPESNELGNLKLEMKIKEGIIVRPKFYAMVNADENAKEKDMYHVKIKGLGKRLSYFEFVGLLNCPLQPNGRTQRIYYDKFTKFKEAIRRDLIPNEIIEVHKEFGLEDEKRAWKNKFNHKVLEDSVPLEIDCGELKLIKLKKLKNKEEDNYRKAEEFYFKDKYKEIIEDDNFDNASVGGDISKKEFIENEKFFGMNE